MRIAGIVFGVTSAAVLGSMIITHSTGQRVLQLEAEQGKQRDALLAIDDFFLMLQDAETGQRGFVITGDEAYLKPFNDARARLPDALRQLYANAQSTSKETGELNKAVDEKMAEL